MPPLKQMTETQRGVVVELSLQHKWWLAEAVETAWRSGRIFAIDSRFPAELGWLRGQIEQGNREVNRCSE